jgi:glycosyltransferase involved in cell wall biosynthesis
MLPKISIITVVYNGMQTLPQTFQSVVNQTYTNIEYIIIDGASKDGTTQWIQSQAQKHRFIIVSEKDNGIYDAMNKGQNIATGDFVQFLNAGDVFYDNHTLQNMLTGYQNEDVIYGDAVRVGPDYALPGSPWHKITPKSLQRRSARYGMVVCHQAILARRALSPTYDLHHPFAADIDWLIRLLSKTTKTRYVGFPVIKFLEGGFSSRKKWASLKDRFQILSRHFGLFNTILTHLEMLFFKR